MAQACRTRGAGTPRWTVAALALGHLLGQAGRATAQQGAITVLSPTRDDEIRAGQSIMVSFNTTGDGVGGPYDLDLYKGVHEVYSWCSESEGCDIDDGSVTVIVSADNEVGPGYYVLVTDRDSLISGESQVFELFPELPSNSTDADLDPQYEEEISAGGNVGDMSLAMLVVASVCGATLVCTLLAACVLMVHRNATTDTDEKKATPDPELGIPLDHATTGRYDSQSSDCRGFSGGNPIPRNRSFSVGSSRSFAATSPARSMAKGDQQRGRPQARDAIGPRMYSSNTPGRARVAPSSPGRDLVRYDSAGAGGAMVVVTPGRSSIGRSARSRTPRRLMSGGDSNRGRQMYDRSNVSSWEESGGRMMGTSKSPGRGLSSNGRSGSTGRMGQPSRYMSHGGDFGNVSRGNRHMTMTPGRRRSERGGLMGSPRIPDIRRSKSLGHGLTRYDDVGTGRWEDRSMTAALERMQRGRRSQRSLSRSARSRSARDISEDHTAATSNGSVHSRSRERRSRSRPTTPSRRQYNRSAMGESDDPSTNSDVSWEELRSSYLKNRTSARRSSALPTYGDAMHHAYEDDSIDDGDSAPHSVQDAEKPSDNLSIGIPNGPSPSSYKSVGRRPRSSHLSRAGSAKESAGPYSNRSRSRSPSERFSPGTRAVSARKAARDAQLSAERALAAAAMASRAADLAAQAALEAEAEADADAVDDDLDSFEEVEMSPPSKSSSGEVVNSLVREKIKVFSGGSALGSTLGSSIASFDKPNTAVKSPLSRPHPGSRFQGGQSESNSKGGQTSSAPKDTSGSLTSSNGGHDGISNGNSNNTSSWVKNGGVGGADTAGGSTKLAVYSEGGNGLPPIVSAPSPARSNEPAELAMRRKAFVQQYSGGSDIADDSDYSLHDHAAAAAIAAAVGRPENGHVRNNSASAMSWDKSSHDGSGIFPRGQEDSGRGVDTAARGGDVIDGQGQGVPKRGRQESSDLNKISDREAFASTSAPSPVVGPSH